MNMPEELYRYYSLDENFDSIFKKGELWFSSPKDFNDPFDFRVINHNDYEISDIISFVSRNGENNPIEANIFAQAVIEKSSYFNQKVNKVINKRLSNKLVCCFTTKSDNLLMWSHYADKHRGVCLKFSPRLDSNLFTKLYAVEYSKNSGNYDFINKMEESFNKVITLKSIDWSYEEEFRVVKYDQERGQKFNKNALKEVVFGCESTSDEIERIMKLAFDNGFHHVNFKMAKQKKLEFGLEFESIK